MTPAITKDILEALEKRLFSGDLLEVQTALDTFKAEELAMDDLLDRVHQLSILLWPEEEYTTAEEFVALTELQTLQIRIEGEATAQVGEITTVQLSSWEELPEDWGSLLPQLQTLEIVGGICVTLAETLGDLERLEKLQLKNLFFEHFPPSFQRLLALKKLTIIHQPAACSVQSPSFSLPDEFRLLESLEELYIESCLFNCIPEQMQRLPSLRKLYINCDLEALTPDYPTYRRLQNRVTPDVLHFVPQSLNAMPRLEELTLLLPARHFPLSAQLFQNTHLRKLRLSSRLVAQLPLHSNELSRIEKIEVFKPNILQHLKLVFSLPEAEIEPMTHAYRRSHIWYNLVLTLFWLPAGAWYLTQELVVFPLIPPKSKFMNRILRLCLSILTYPLALFVFMIAILYFGILRLAGKGKQTSIQREETTH